MNIWDELRVIGLGFENIHSARIMDDWRGSRWESRDPYRLGYVFEQHRWTMRNCKVIKIIFDRSSGEETCASRSTLSSLRRYFQPFSNVIECSNYRSAFGCLWSFRAFPLDIRNKAKRRNKKSTANKRKTGWRRAMPSRKAHVNGVIRLPDALRLLFPHSR